MATVNTVSYHLKDKTGNAKSMPIYFPTGLSVANIQAGADAIATALDAVSDAVIESYSVELQLTKAGGLKTVAGDAVAREGALLGYAAAGTAYQFSVFVPAWLEAGFVNNDALTSTVFGTFEQLLVTGGGTGGALLVPSDRYANDLTSFLEGKRRFRK